MYTHCPHCDTYFRITSTQLKSANGDVRCGRDLLRWVTAARPRYAWGS